jgi:DNA-binding FrmR family transcriptional regulator
MTPQSRDKIQNRLSRIAGQVTGLQKMVAEDRYCVDILTQVAAIRSAIDALGVELLTNHVETCVAGHHGETAHGCARTQSTDEVLQELRLSLSRFLK